MLISQTAQSEFIGLPSYGYVAFGQPSALPDAGEPAAIGNVLANDAGAQPSDTLSVVGVQAGQHGNAVTGGVGETLTGTYGTLILLADGSYTYNLDNGDRDTNALLDGEVVFDRFSYTAADEDGNTAVAEIAIQITGAADIGQTIVTSGSAPIYLVGGDGDDTLQSSSNADRLVGGVATIPSLVEVSIRLSSIPPRKVLTRSPALSPAAATNSKSRPMASAAAWRPADRSNW